MDLQDPGHGSGRPPANFFTLLIIEMAMHFSIALFVFVVFVLKQSWEANPQEVPADIGVLRLALTAVCFTTTALSLIFPLISPAKVKGQNIETVLMPSSEVPPFWHKLILKIEPEQIQHVQTVAIVRMALGESIAIMGFVIAFLGRDASLIIPYAAWGLVLQVIVGPLFAKMVRG